MFNVMSFDVIYLYLISILLFLSWYYLRKSQYDERRGKRFLLKNMKRQFSSTVELFKNEKHDMFLRKQLFPRWVKSEHVNIIRLAIPMFLIIVVIVGVLNQRMYLNTLDLLTWGMIPILLLPREKYPLHLMAKILNRGRKREMSFELYQLYNDIKATYQTMINPPSTYYQIVDLLPYYNHIRPAMERMLPYLEQKKKVEAWSMFSKELNMEEAGLLAVMMQEVESLPREQAVVLLEQKRASFSNHLFNQFSDILKRRKNLIMIIIVAGAITVIWNEFTVFFMWYSEIMSVVNQNT